ncbi:MAG TPA: insulinase family protein [Acidobacteriaceae bacterium]|nr:insulinase family protein [Acidobacteriaceae bacterium]
MATLRIWTRPIEDVQKFYQAYYTPNNAVLAVVGDVNSDAVFAKVEKYFAAIPSRPTPPHGPLEEPPQKAERRSSESDALARVPALAIGYHMPPRHSPDALAGAVAGELLHNGQASLLYQTLVKDKQVALEVDGGVNWPLGTPCEYNGPTLMTSFVVYPPNVSEDQVLAAYDAAVQNLATKGPSQADVDRIVAKMRSDWYGNLEIPISRASALSHAVLYDGNFDSVYALPDELRKITPEQVRAFAAKYLVSTNRTIINRTPSGGGAQSTGGGQ